MATLLPEHLTSIVSYVLSRLAYVLNLAIVTAVRNTYLVSLYFHTHNTTMTRQKLGSLALDPCSKIHNYFVCIIFPLTTFVYTKGFTFYNDRSETDYSSCRTMLLSGMGAKLLNSSQYR